MANHLSGSVMRVSIAPPSRPAGPTGMHRIPVSGLMTTACRNASRSFPHRQSQTWISKKFQETPPSWLRFWFYETDVRALPRFWLRWAFEYIQRYKTVIDGTPCDTQLATYLPEADVFISADKAFIQILY
jgi:hypothetical protein